MELATRYSRFSEIFPGSNRFPNPRIGSKLTKKRVFSTGAFTWTQILFVSVPVGDSFTMPQAYPGSTVPMYFTRDKAGLDARSGITPGKVLRLTAQ